jgi:hypothetical protein
MLCPFPEASGGIGTDARRASLGSEDRLLSSQNVGADFAGRTTDRVKGSAFATRAPEHMSQSVRQPHHDSEREHTSDTRYARCSPECFRRTGGTRMPTGRGEAKDKKAKKKSKDQLEKELKRKTVSAPIQPMTVELVPRKRKEKDW